MAIDTPQPSPPRGSALLLVMVLLLVLTVIGIAAVSLSSQERINASAKGKRDRMAACANAARLVIWSQLARQGTGIARAAMTEMQVFLSDGTMLGAPAHYSGSDAEQVVALRTNRAPLASTGEKVGGQTYMTNTFGSPDLSKGSLEGRNTTAYAFVARCRDPKGREIEVEFTTGLLF